MLSREDKEKNKSKDLAVKLKALSGEQQERLAEHRAQALSLPYINLVIFPINVQSLEYVPKDMSEESQGVLFYKQGKDIRVGVVNPVLEGAKKLIKYVEEKFQTPPQVYVISYRSFSIALSRYRNKRIVSTKEQEAVLEGSEINTFDADIKNLNELGGRITSLPPSEILATVVSGAIKMDASDIHIEPGDKETRLRYRIDGVLQDVINFSNEGWKALLSRVKVLSNLKINVHTTPQDGSFVLKIGESVYDIRVSILPGGFGENIVMRILDRVSRTIEITDLGMKDRDYKIVLKELEKSNGMILVTGPTGSGKTTSLASFVEGINSSDIKIITLEDPIEYHLKGVEQTQIDVSSGYTFAKGLRAILRQDPDVIMLGEIRDVETAETALQAALTGHLVFTTLHTNDASGAVSRLMDLGAKPFTIAPAVNLIMAQRLVRKVCRDCSSKYKPDRKELEHIRDVMSEVLTEIFDPKVLENENLEFVRAEGCKKCAGTGYKGRVGVFEVMVVEGKLEELILQGADSNKIRNEAFKTGMTTILQDGYLKVIEGITTIDEIKRISED